MFVFFFHRSVVNGYTKTAFKKSPFVGGVGKLLRAEIVFLKQDCFLDSK